MDTDTQRLYDALVIEINKLHDKKELSKTIGSDYFEPGMMENLDQYEGVICKDNDSFLLRFDVRGTRYEGKTEQIEKVKVGDRIQVIREYENPYNSNNFTFLIAKEKNVGNMPAELCNVMAPLYDAGLISINEAAISYVEPISKRSRYAKQAVLFVELRVSFINEAV